MKNAIFAMLFAVTFGLNGLVANESGKNCADCSKDKGNCWAKIKSWMTHHEVPQGLNHGGPRFQGERQMPLYLYFYNPCREKCASSCDSKPHSECSNSLKTTLESPK